MNEHMGEQAVDIITGFKGTVTAYYEFINGCKQYLIEAPMTKEGETKIQALDEDRLEFTSVNRVVLEKQTVPGGGFRTTPSS